MAQQFRYTGGQARIDFAGVTVSNDYSELQVELQMRIEEKTAGADTDATYNTTIKEGKATLKLFDTGENGTAIATILRVGTAGNLTVWTKGNTTGKPIMSFPAIVTHFKEPIQFDKNILLDIEFIKNGPMISDVGVLA